MCWWCSCSGKCSSGSCVSACEFDGLESCVCDTGCFLHCIFHFVHCILFIVYCNFMFQLIFNIVSLTSLPVFLFRNVCVVCCSDGVSVVPLSLHGASNTVSQQKQDTKLLPITSPKLINWFSNLFTDGLRSKFSTNLCLKIPPRLKHVVTLPCEIWMSV